ncbi:hypothetical protein B296_00025421 [Ensete ventricosum]|uniref:Uncharacterized protein n=1 Tax=Ensete ventricosum TaxID=4639 RepID=A0A426YPY0_ENSVE|nr:hypothetical protein B296_00025421 [Ensete ventricosum]
MQELGKLDLCQDKYAMVEAQGQMCLKHMSQENPTCAKINPLCWRHKDRHAQDT